MQNEEKKSSEWVHVYQLPVTQAQKTEIEAYAKEVGLKPMHSIRTILKAFFDKRTEAAKQ